MPSLENTHTYIYIFRISHPLLFFVLFRVSCLGLQSGWLGGAVSGMLIKEQPVAACSQQFGGNHLTLEHGRDQSLQANTGRESQLQFYLKPDATPKEKT